MLSRDDYRKIKGMSKDEMSKWLNYHNLMMDNKLRKQYNDAYKDELDSSVQNFITAIAYTLHYNEDIHLQHDELASFMEDLYVSVEMFRKGEYNPEDYREQLKEDGIEIAKYDYDKLYRQHTENIKKQYLPYKECNDKAIKLNGEIKTKIFDMENISKEEVLKLLDELDNVLGGE